MFAGRDLGKARKRAQANANWNNEPWVIFSDTCGNLHVCKAPQKPTDVIETVLPEPCPHYEDNQGFCHSCGILMNEWLARETGYFRE